MFKNLQVAIRKTWRKLPWRLRSVFARMAAYCGVTPRPLPPPGRAEPGAISAGPIIVSGFFQDTRGIAQAGRLMVAGLRAAGFSVVEHDVSYLLDRNRARSVAPPPSGGVWVIACNPVEALAILDQHRELSEAPLYRIGAWVWELPVAPRAWLEMSCLFHELWVPSQFCANAFARTATPLTVMPYPLPLPPLKETWADIGGGVLFATFADMRSGAARKNVAGALEAYLQAFPQANDAKLVIKIQSSETDPDAVAVIAKRISDREDIQLVLETLTATEMAALYARTDVVLSLHRAEGFGLPLAEAMAAGKAVVATGWSGNLEFMTGAAARQLVPFKMVEVRDPSGLYANASWAEPDLAAAAQLILDFAYHGELRKLMETANRDAIQRVNARWTVEALSGLAFAKWTEKDGNRA